MQLDGGVVARSAGPDGSGEGGPLQLQQKGRSVLGAQ